MISLWPKTVVLRIDGDGVTYECLSDQNMYVVFAVVIQATHQAIEKENVSTIKKLLNALVQW